MKQVVLSMLLTMLLTACLGGMAYQAYQGDRLPDSQIAIIEGAQFIRQQWLNRYVDAVRLVGIDGIPIDNDHAYSRLEVIPGDHEIRVYFHWDRGNSRGMAPALISYAASREGFFFRTLRFHARAGEFYRVVAQPQFSGGKQDITTLTHIDFWVEDQAGNKITGREAGDPLPGVE